MSIPSPTTPSASSPPFEPSTDAVQTFLAKTIYRNRWIPHRPTAKQAAFLTNPAREAFYGGAAGGGKTDAILMGALQYVAVPGYSALILMRSYADLSLPKAGISRSKEWLAGTGAHWSGETKTWTFPSGATLTFGYLEHDDDCYHYRTAEFQYVAFDELTRFNGFPYRFMFSRLRRLEGSEIPIRMRAASNPGDRGHAWVKDRFIPDDFHRTPEDERFKRVWWKDGRAFIPARKEDNAHLDREDYALSLAELDPVTREQLDKGDWQAHAGGRFKREWFKRYRDLGDCWLVDGKPYPKRGVVVTCDPAGRKTKASKYTAAGAGAEISGQRLLITEAIRERYEVHEICPALNALCARQRPHWLGVEANGFQMMLVAEARDRQRYPYIPTVRELDPEGKSKLTRATPAIIRAEQGQIYLPEPLPPWGEPLLSEWCMFTGDDAQDAFSDQVDWLAYMVNGLDRYGVGGGRPVAGKGKGER